MIIKQNLKNFNIGVLKKTKVTASSGLLLILKFAEEIGLFKEIDKRFSHLKERDRGYSVSQMFLSILSTFIKGGNRLSDINALSSDPGLLDILGMSKLPNENTFGGFARKFTQRDIFNLSELVMKLSSNIIKLKGLKEVIIDIDSSIVESKINIARKCYEGTIGFNPLMSIIKYGKILSMAGFSLFRYGNASPQSNNLSLIRKMVNYLKQNNPGLKITLRIDSAGYNYRIMRFCDENDVEFIIAGDKYDIILKTILQIKKSSWEKLNKKGNNKKLQKEKKIEEVAEGVHFIGPEKKGFGVENILSEDFLANAVFFQLQLLAYNLVQYFKYANLKKSWWNQRIKQLRFRLINIVGVIVNHSRNTILRLHQNYKYRQLAIKILNLIFIKRAQLLI